MTSGLNIGKSSKESRPEKVWSLDGADVGRPEKVWSFDGADVAVGHPGRSRSIGLDAEGFEDWVIAGALAGARDQSGPVALSLLGLAWSR